MRTLAATWGSSPSTRSTARAASSSRGATCPLIRAAYELKRYGIDPRLLKAHVQRANREVPLFKQVLSSAIGRQASLDDPKTLQSFNATLDRLIQLSDTVSDRLIRRGVEREFRRPAGAAGPSPRSALR